MNEQEVLQTLQGVVVEGHFVLNSGKHANRYVNKDGVYPHTHLISKLCLEIAQRFISYRVVVEVVIGPAIGGVILSQWTAHHLSALREREVLSVYAEKGPTGDEFVIQRGYDELVRGKNVLVVEDIFTSGGSAKKTVEAARRSGGTVVAVGGLGNRGEVDIEQVGNPPLFFALANLTGFKADTWNPSDCPLCANNVPINAQLGKGREFLAAKQAKS